MPLLPSRTFLRIAFERPERAANCGDVSNASQHCACVYRFGGVALPAPIMNMPNPSATQPPIPSWCPSLFFRFFDHGEFAGRNIFDGLLNSAWPNDQRFINACRFAQA